MENRVYDSSFLGKWNACPKWTYWGYIKGLDLKEAPEARNFGFLFHEALALTLKGATEEEALKVFEEIPKFVSEKYSRERAGLFLRGYRKKWSEEPFEIEEVEVEFHVGLENGAIISGRIDVIGKWQGYIYVVDHKTAGSVGVSFFKQFLFPCLQMDTYSWACKKLKGECAGVIINGISTADKPKEERFQRQVFGRTAQEIERAEENLIIMVEEVERCLLEKKFPMRTSYCSMYGGCVFRALCQDEEVGMLSGRYEEKVG